MSEQRDSTDQELGFLEKLSIEDLEALLKTSGNPNDVETFFDAVIKEVVRREKKEPTGRLPDIDVEWEEFQTRCNTLNRLAQKEYKDEESTNFILKNLDVALCERSAAVMPHRTAHRILHAFAIIVLSIVLTFAAMVGAQAAGTNVFESLAAWTDAVFHFVPKKPDTNSQLSDALRSQNMPEELAPAKIPAGMELVEITMHRNQGGKFVIATFEDRDSFLGIEIQKCHNLVEEGVPWHEKDSGEVERFVSHGREFYIFSNIDQVMATWADRKSLVVTVWGNISIDEIREVISSIGG